MCNDIELEQDFEFPEMPKVTSCDVPSSMTDYFLQTMDEVDFPCSGNDLFDIHLEMSMDENVDSLNLNGIRSEVSAGTGFDDIEKIKQELDDELSISSHDIDYLREKAEGIERAEISNMTSFKGIKICATRHGCTGATNCDYSLGAPIGR